MINRESINGTFVTSVAAIAIAAIVLLSSVPSLVTAMFTSAGAKGDPKSEIARLAEEHDEMLAKYRARFAGRSAFYPPPPPPPEPRAPRVEPPRVEAPVVVDEPVWEPDPEPEPPAEYYGPAPFIVMSDLAVFRPQRANERTINLRIGQEKDGLKLIATDPPRSVLVQYDRGEYLVEVFPWDVPGLVNRVDVPDSIPGLVTIQGGEPAHAPPVPASAATFDAPPVMTFEPDAEAQANVEADVEPEPTGEFEPEDGAIEPFPGPEDDPEHDPALDEPIEEPEVEEEEDPEQGAAEEEEDPEEPSDDPEDVPEDDPEPEPK